MVKQYAKVRVENPNEFIKSSFRTQDIGRKGHSLRISAISKKTGKYKTQAYRILKSDIIKAGGIDKTLLGKSLSKKGKIIKKDKDYKFISDKNFV